VIHKTSGAFENYLRGKDVTFVGLGVSHSDLIQAYVKKGLSITLCDRRPADQLPDIVDDLRLRGVKLLLGEDYPDDIPGDVIFRSPGMKFYADELAGARRRGAVITSELEVFFDLCPCPILAVTGSDGKTTTTTLICEFLQAQGKRVFKGGNIGKAMLPLIDEVTAEDYAVVELSSFQLISMRTSPYVAVVTNVAPNHLDMHKDMAEYVDAKKNIFLHQGAFDRAVFNLDNDITAGFFDESRSHTCGFSRRTVPARGAYLSEDGMICYHDGKEHHALFAASDIRLPGVHNIENYLAAITAVWGLVSVESMHKVAREFGGVEHRMEFIREYRGAKWYNDSIATSPTRTIAALRSFPGNVVLLAGGYDKKIPFEPMVDDIYDKVRLLILFGVTAQKIEDAVTASPRFGSSDLEIVRTRDLAEATEYAARLCRKDDIVTLSPACASFDAYRNFELRGQHFKKMVRSLTE